MDIIGMALRCSGRTATRMCFGVPHKRLCVTIYPPGSLWSDDKAAANVRLVSFMCRPSLAYGTGKKSFLQGRIVARCWLQLGSTGGEGRYRIDPVCSLGVQC